MIASVDNLDELCDAVRGGPRLVPKAGGSKPGLWETKAQDVAVLDVSGLRGMLEYNPAELTFTARAATPVAEVESELAQHGQYLPFDPPLASAGATLAGVVAAATSGPRAFRHGGVRDFVIGVQFVDGTGRLVAGGGKVVKNAAGFDFSKLMVGSMGRLGVITTLSFKVLPRPRATTTLAFERPSVAAALTTMSALARGPIHTDALDVTGGGTLLVRLGGNPDVLGARAERCARIVGAAPVTLDAQQEAEQWAAATELTWVPDGSTIVRVGLTSADASALAQTVLEAGAAVRFSLAANVAWIAWPPSRSIAELDRALLDLGLRGMRLTGAGSDPALLGAPHGGAFGARIRQALDPNNRFPEA